MKKILNEHQGISIGDYVEVPEYDHKRGYIASIVDYGTHIRFFVDFGEILKFPAKREWITKIEDNDD